MTDHQTAWRKTNIISQEHGQQNGKRYPWILPRDLWEEGLWPGIRSGTKNSLPQYLADHAVQKHGGVHNLKSSWMQCANLYFPFGGSPEGRSILARFLHEHVTDQVQRGGFSGVGVRGRGRPSSIGTVGRGRWEQGLWADFPGPRSPGQRWPRSYTSREQTGGAFFLPLFGPAHYWLYS